MFENYINNFQKMNINLYFLIIVIYVISTQLLAIWYLCDKMQILFIQKEILSIRSIYQVKTYVIRSMINLKEHLLILNSIYLNEWMSWYYSFYGEFRKFSWKATRLICPYKAFNIFNKRNALGSVSWNSLLMKILIYVYTFTCQNFILQSYKHVSLLF